MKKAFRYRGIFLCLAELLFGVLLLISPIRFTAAILFLGGILLLIAGIIQIVFYFRTSPALAAGNGRLTFGLSLCMAGLFIILRCRRIAADFPVLSVLYALFCLGSALTKVQWTADSFRLKNGGYLFPGIGVLLSLLTCLLIFLSPFSSESTLWRFVGIALIAAFAVDLVAVWKSSGHAGPARPAKPGKPDAPTSSQPVKQAQSSPTEKEANSGQTERQARSGQTEKAAKTSQTEKQARSGQTQKQMTNPQKPGPKAPNTSGNVRS